MKGEPFVYVDLCKPLAPDFIKGGYMQDIEYLKAMIEAVHSTGECVLEVIFLDSAVIAHLMPTINREDEDDYE